MKYELLAPENFHLLQRFNEVHNLPEPLAGESLVAVIENESEIIARWDVHRALHLDNGCIAEKWRDKFLNLRKLFNLLYNECPQGTRIYTTCATESSARLLKLLKFEASSFPLFTKDKK